MLLECCITRKDCMCLIKTALRIWFWMNFIEVIMLGTRGIRKWSQTFKKNTIGWVWRRMWLSIWHGVWSANKLRQNINTSQGYCNHYPFHMEVGNYFYGLHNRLPKTRKNNDSIMVVVDKLSKVVHYIPVQSTYNVVQIAHTFMQNIFRLHGLPRKIISDHDVKFTSVFWKTLFIELGTQLNFSIVYHPQTDGQTECVNQVVEDMLRAYVMGRVFALAWICIQ